MAHNLAFDKETGEASLFSLKEKPWHGLGQVVEEAKTSEEVIKLSHLDFNVVKVPNEINWKNEMKKTGSFSTVREDTGDVLGNIMLSRYTICQNIEVFKFLDSLAIDKVDIQYETAGALGLGETVFVSVKLPNYLRIKGSDDIIEKYLICTNNHNGISGLSAYFTDIRVVCNNTLSASFKDASNRINLRHTSSILERLRLGRQVLDLELNYSKKLNEALDQLLNVKFSDKDEENFIKSVFLTKDELDALSKGELNTRKSNMLGSVLESLHCAPGQNMYEGTTLHTYNGITSYLQNVKEYKSPDRKMSGINLGGEESALTSKVMNLLLSVC